MHLWTLDRWILLFERPCIFWYDTKVPWQALTHFINVPKRADSRAVATVVTELKQCSHRKELQQGRTIHLKCIRSGLDDNKYVANTLITMYSRCGSMQESWQAFRRMSLPDSVSWNAVIHGYVENGQSLAALEVFSCMDRPRTSVSFVGAFKACAALAGDSSLEQTSYLEKGLAIQREATELGFVRDVVVAGSLVDMYSKCGDMKLARQVFEGMKQRSVVSWNALLHGYVENGESDIALEMFTRMDCEPDGVTIVAALKAVAECRTSDKETCLERGSHVHRLARQAGVERETQVANTLVGMYSKCGNMELAREVFNGMERRSVVSWTALVLGYVENGNCCLGLESFDRMDCPPDSVTFVAALKACARLLAETKLSKETCRCKGVTVHRRAQELGFEKDVFVASALVDMYSKFGEMEKAQEVFDTVPRPNVVLWNTLIVGYVDTGECSRALEVFSSMDCAPDRVSFVSTLKACAVLAASGGHPDRKAVLRRGVLIHRLATELGLQEDTMVANTLIDMYSKCGEMRPAREVFEKMVQRDVVSWTSLILGYIDNGESSTALSLFITMDCSPNSVTLAAGLKACGCVGALEAGREIHDRICELGLEQDERLASSLVDFYGKCGDTDAAEGVFSRMKTRDVVSWNALIGGYSLGGDAARVFSLVKRMESEQGLQMDSVTVSLVLSACSHAGMVEEGKVCFESMRKYGIRPTVEHCNCLVDLLGRANRVEEAVSVISEMALEVDGVTWKTLLSSCKKWSNVQVGRVAFDALVSLGDASDIAFASLLMEDIYRSSSS